MQVLEIWYAALSGGPLPSFFSMMTLGPKIILGQGVLGSNHRNALKYIQKSSYSESLGSDA